MRPELQARIAEHHAARPPHDRVRATGDPGELAIAATEDLQLRRVVLVTSSREADRTLSIVLASNRTEMATDFDAVVTPETSSAPYDLVVQGELYGPIFEEQLDWRVGELDTTTTSALAHALDSDGESLVGLSVGTPLGGADDPRRSFKDSELDELTQLVSSCRQWIANGRAESVDLDPRVLFPPPRGTPPDEALDAVDALRLLLDEFEAAGHRPSFDLITFLADEAFEELRRWHREFGFDLWRRLERLAYGEFELPDVRSRADVRATVVAAYATAGVSTLDQWTFEADAWGDLLVETSDGSVRGVCRARARIGAARV